MADPFSLLGLTREASPTQVRLAFRDKARLAHPDGGGVSGTFHELTKARDAALIELRSMPCLGCGGRGTRQVVHGWSSVDLTCTECHGQRMRWPIV